MRKLMMGGLVAATLGLPAAALARQNPLPSDHLANNNGNFAQLPPRVQPRLVDSQQSPGGGMQGGNEPGHTAGPGAAKVDNSSRGPVNDVDPGRGTNDTRQSVNPPAAQ